MRMYIYIYVCLHIFVYTYSYTYIHMYTNMYTERWRARTRACVREGKTFRSPDTSPLPNTTLTKSIANSTRCVLLNPPRPSPIAESPVPCPLHALRIAATRRSRLREKRGYIIYVYVMSATSRSKLRENRGDCNASVCANCPSQCVSQNATLRFA